MTTWTRRSLPVALWALVAASGCADPERLQVYGQDITPGWANLMVRDASGKPLDDAKVTVNGVPIPRRSAEPGLYSGEYDPAAVADKEVHVEVTRDGSEVTGHGRVPMAPAMTWPPTDAYAPSSGDLRVEWSVDLEPDRFVVSVEWSCGDGCGTGKTFEAEVWQRALVIPADSLPYAQIAGGDVTVTVLAYNDGVLEGDYEVYPEYPGLHLRAESRSAVLHTTFVGQTCSLLEVSCEDIGAGWANVRVRDLSGWGLDDAKVVVNSAELAPSSEPGRYFGPFEPSAGSGREVQLRVNRCDEEVTGVGTLPLAPTLTAPAEGGDLPASGDVTVEWTAPEEPAYFMVSLSWSCGFQCGTGKKFRVPATARALTIPGASLPYGSGTHDLKGDLLVRVFAYEEGVLQGDLVSRPSAGMKLRAESNDAVVHTTLVVR